MTRPCAAHSLGGADNVPIQAGEAPPWRSDRPATPNSDDFAVDVPLQPIEMGITRKQLLASVAGGTVTLLIQACGGGGESAFLALFGGGTNGDDTDDDPTPGSPCGSSGSGISGNHGHVLTVPTGDLMSTNAMTYSIMGSATHDHLVTLLPDDLALLNSGGTVTVVSSVTDAPTFGLHSHGVTVTCV